MGEMEDSQGRGRRRSAAEELILRTIAAHADSLLRTARRHSMCVDDAQDAYQRTIELFMGHASRLDAARAPGWLHVVIKREAQAIQQERRKLLMSTEVDLDGHEAQSVPSPEEQLLRFDVVARSAEALKRLRPSELRALWLRAQGHSYSEIGAITGWSYTKVNRCVSEGRRNFLEQYRGIESGEECERWLAVLSAMVDGEATPEQLAAIRPHLANCPGCRATLRALRDSTTPMAALFPVPLLVADPGIGDQIAHYGMRLYEGVAHGLHERAVNSFTKAQALLEASAAGKVAAVAASAAAVAGGGYASVERIVERPIAARPVVKAASYEPLRTKATFRPATATKTTSTAKASAAPAAGTTTTPRAKRNEFGAKPVKKKTARLAPEFGSQPRATAAQARTTFESTAATARSQPKLTPPPPPPARPAPEFSNRGPAPEFGP